MTSGSGNSCGCGCNNNRCGNYGTLSYLARRQASGTGLTGCNGQSIYYTGPCGCVSGGCSGVCYPWQDCSCGCGNCVQTPYGCGGNWNTWNTWNNWNGLSGYGIWNGRAVQPEMYGCGACSASFSGRWRMVSGAGGFALGFSRGSYSDFDVWNDRVRFRWAGRYVASFSADGCCGGMALALNGHLLSAAAAGSGHAVFEASAGDCLSVVPAEGFDPGAAAGVTLIIYRIG